MNESLDLELRIDSLEAENRNLERRIRDLESALAESKAHAVWLENEYNREVKRGNDLQVKLWGKTREN